MTATLARPPKAAPAMRTVEGILDIRDSHGFVRTDGYLPGPDDAYLPLSQIRSSGLRRGDLLAGTASTDKQRRLVRLDTVNGAPADDAQKRPEFYDMTPLYPLERLRLETDAGNLTTRAVDLFMPMGKGQRALIVSPPKAGKTMVLQAIARAISRNHPECHLMAVLVDERPEEVTEMRRTVDAEVIASTFDRPPRDHIAVTELAVERAKRLAEAGRDVVVLLDSLTRLGRAYNLAAPAGGRTLTGGIDSAALHGPKRVLGAARNTDDGGTLTIIATALVETGSAGDTLTFEEFKSTGNAELRLVRAAADRRVFPAIDIEQSGTRKEELLLAPDELALVRRLRGALKQTDIDQLLDRLRRTGSNAEFLLSLARTDQGPRAS